jgi:hypothetical protein
MERDDVEDKCAAGRADDNGRETMQTMNKRQHQSHFLKPLCSPHSPDRGRGCQLNAHLDPPRICKPKSPALGESHKIASTVHLSKPKKNTLCSLRSLPSQQSPLK